MRGHLKSKGMWPAVEGKEPGGNWERWRAQHPGKESNGAVITSVDPAAVQKGEKRGGKLIKECPQQQMGTGTR